MGSDREDRPLILNRRGVLVGLGALAAAGAVTLRESHCIHSGRGTAFVAATESDLLADSVGVNTHLNFRGSPYFHTGQLLQQLEDLGVRHIRNRVTQTAPVPATFEQLAHQGIRVQGICGAFGDPQPMGAVMQGVLRRYTDPTRVFSAFEGINEPNNNERPWVAETRSKARALYLARHAAGLDAIKIVSPALARVNGGGAEGSTLAQQAVRLGSLTDLVDEGNIHDYPRLQTPGTDVDRLTSYQRHITGNLSIVCSETGYFDAVKYSGKAFPTPEDVCATYLPRLLMEHWVRGIRRSYIYEMLDDIDPTRSVRLASFGLLRVTGSGAQTWSPKPSYYAVKNFLSLLADPGPSHQVGGLSFGLSAVSQVTRVLTAKRDGSRYLLMWRRVSSWDPAARRRLNVTPVHAHLTLAGRRRVTLYDPTRSPSPVQTFSPSRTVSFPIADRLLVARID